MPILVRLIQQHNFPQLQLEAAKTLTTVALKDVVLIEPQAIPACVNQLDSRKNKVLKHVMMFLEVFFIDGFDDGYDGRRQRLTWNIWTIDEPYSTKLRIIGQDLEDGP